MKEHFYQCTFRRFSKEGTLEETVGWVPEKAAKVGKVVELLEMGEGFNGLFWTVHKVNPTGMLQETLREHQKNTRNSLPSIRGMDD